MTDLAQKRQKLVSLMNSALGSRYTVDSPDVATLPEPVLDELLDFYGSGGKFAY